MNKPLLVFILVFILSGCSKKKDPGIATPDGTQISTNIVSRDIVIYGGTVGGIMAAVQAVKLGKTVALICNTLKVGGTTTGGLSNMDVGNPIVVGGLAEDFFKRVKVYYNNSDWVYQAEPKVNSLLLNQYLTENKIEVFYSERLKPKSGVEKNGTDITQITMESGRIFVGKMFIDASYEGDLMAQAGVKYTIGREDNAMYGEQSNGTLYPQDTGLDPYLIQGNPSSGLLPNVTANYTYKQADFKTQAYNFRLILTKKSGNTVPVKKPANYNENDYEILFRLFAKTKEGDEKDSVLSFSKIPNEKFDVNNNGVISTDNVGGNYNYADGDYETRRQIWDKQVSYQQGFIWTIQNSLRVPDRIRKKFAGLGLPADEFVDNDNWPTQLYVREGRRMLGTVVMNENMLKGRVIVSDPVGMGSYNADSHWVQLVVFNGKLAAEGAMFNPIAPYSISYQSIVPKKSECTNLYVTFCVSASHVAFCSIRMEPVLMVLSQSAAIAAAIAIDDKVNVQSVDYAKLKLALLKEKQVLSVK